MSLGSANTQSAPEDPAFVFEAVDRDYFVVVNTQSSSGSSAVYIGFSDDIVAENNGAGNAFILPENNDYLTFKVNQGDSLYCTSSNGAGVLSWYAYI